MRISLSRKPHYRKTPVVYTIEGNTLIPIVYLKRSKFATDEQYESILQMFEPVETDTNQEDK